MKRSDLVNNLQLKKKKKDIQWIDVSLPRYLVPRSKGTNKQLLY